MTNQEIYKVLFEFERRFHEAMKEAEAKPMMSLAWFGNRREADTWAEAKAMLEKALHKQSK